MSNERWPALMTAAQAAEYLGISTRTLHRERNRQRIRSKVVRGDISKAGMVRFWREDLDRYIEELAYDDGTFRGNFVKGVGDVDDVSEQSGDPGNAGIVDSPVRSRGRKSPAGTR